MALRNRADSNHAAAVRLIERHSAGPLITTNHVRGETWTFLRRRAGHASAVDFLEALEHSPRIRVFRVADLLEEQALRWLRRRDEREYSFVDATSFAVMQLERMRQALAFDGDFSAAGFVELRD